MPTPRQHRRRLVQGHRYVGEDTNTAGSPRTTAPSASLSRLTTPPDELGVIGAELAKRLTMAAEDFLTELAARQVRDSFRQELGVALGDHPEEE